MRRPLILVVVFILPSLVFALDPQLTSYTNTELLAGQQVDFTIDFDPDLTNGNIRFYDNNVFITQQAYDDSMTQTSFNYTWNNPQNTQIKFTINDFNQDDDLTNNEITADLVIPKGLDLTISDISVSPTTLVSGETATVFVAIFNEGDQSYSGNIPIVIKLDDSVVGTINITDIDFAPKTSSLDIIVPPNFYGNHEIKAVVNETGLINEFSIINNTEVLTVQGQQEPDLEVTNIATDGNIRRDGLEPIDVVVRNNGGSTAKNVLLRVFWQGGTLIHESRIAQVLANSETSISFVYSFNQIGDMELNAHVDPDSEIQESNESNNEFSKTSFVEDFNLSDIIVENDDLRTQVIEAEARIQAIEVEKKGVEEALVRVERELENVRSNLNICNTTNSTSVKDYLVNLDVNREVFVNDLQSKINSCNSQLAVQNQNFNERVAERTSSLENQNNFKSGLLAALAIGALLYWQRDKFKRNKRRGEKVVTSVWNRHD